MGYQIKYSPEDDHKYPVRRTEKRSKWILSAVLAGALLVTAGIPRVRHTLANWLIPGDAQVTKVAFAVMLDQIRTGEPIDEAVTAFCREIIYYGKPEDILVT